MRLSFIDLLLLSTLLTVAIGYAFNTLAEIIKRTTEKDIGDHHDNS